VVAESAARRAALAADLLSDAIRLREQLFSPYQTSNWCKDGTLVTATLTEPDAATKRNLSISLAVLVDKHCVLDKHDGQEEDLSAVGEWLARLRDESP